MPARFAGRLRLRRSLRSSGRCRPGRPLTESLRTRMPANTPPREPVPGRCGRPPGPLIAGSCGVLQVDADVFDLEELLDADGTPFSAESRRLDPAKRCGGIGYHALVDPDHAGF